jgi:hypothetical protein
VAKTVNAAVNTAANTALNTAATTDAAGDKFMRNHAILPSSHLKQARLQLVEYGIAPARALMIALHNPGSAACRQGFSR